MATKAQMEQEFKKSLEEKQRLINELEESLTKAYIRIDESNDTINNHPHYKALETTLSMRDKRIEQLIRENDKLETKLKKAQAENVKLKNEINAKTQIETNQVHNERGAGRKKTKLNMSQEELKQAIEKNGIDAVAKELGVSKRTIYRRLKTNDKIN